MTVSRNDFHNGVMAYMLKLNCYPQNFYGVGRILKAIFSCLNLKPGDRFLPYDMPGVFNKTGHSLTAAKILYLLEISLRHSCTQSFLGE